MNDYEIKDIYISYGLIIRTNDKNIPKIKEFIKSLENTSLVFDRVSYGRLRIKEEPSILQEDGDA